MYVTKEQYQQACAVDLSAWLLTYHPDQVMHKYGSVLLRADDHVSVKDGYTGYKDWRSGETGNNIDYLMSYLGYTYPAAVMALLGLSDGPEVFTINNYYQGKGMIDTSDENAEFTLPERAETSRNVYANLSMRGIPMDVIKELICRRLLYQSEKGNNAVFVTPELDYCEIRGTNTYADRRCKYRAECDQYSCGDHQHCNNDRSCERYKPDPFHGCKKERPTLFWYLAEGKKPYQTIYICEAAIDAISLYVLHKMHGIEDPAVYVSIGGVANQNTIDRIKHHSHGTEVVIATDNDAAGDDCRDRNAELKTIRPASKDWNEDLQRGIYYADTR